MADTAKPETIGAALKHTRAVLEHSGIEGWDVEARLLCEWATGLDRLSFVTQAQAAFHAENWHTLSDAIGKRLSGMPVYRIMGYRPFYGLDLQLSRATLEPRPDTETIVDLVLAHVRLTHRGHGPIHILDLGTGSGAIGLALASHLPNARVVLSDISAPALETALMNAERFGLLRRVSGMVSDWFSNVSGTFDVIASNPPYIRSADIPVLDREVREHDPLAALDGGPDGLEPYRIIAAQCGAFLKPGGCVAVEFGFDQAPEVAEIFSTFGFEKSQLRKDLGGRDRALLFTQCIA